MPVSMLARASCPSAVLLMGRGPGSGVFGVALSACSGVVALGSCFAAPVAPDLFGASTPSAGSVKHSRTRGISIELRRTSKHFLLSDFGIFLLTDASVWRMMVFMMPAFWRLGGFFGNTHNCVRILLPDIPVSVNQSQHALCGSPRSEHRERVGFIKTDPARS